MSAGVRLLPAARREALGRETELLLVWTLGR